MNFEEGSKNDRKKVEFVIKKFGKQICANFYFLLCLPSFHARLSWFWGILLTLCSQIMEVNFWGEKMAAFWNFRFFEKFFNKKLKHDVRHFSFLEKKIAIFVEFKFHLKFKWHFGILKWLKQFSKQNSKIKSQIQLNFDHFRKQKKKI